MYFNFLHIVLKILIFYYSVNNLHVCSLAYNTKNEKKNLIYCISHANWLLLKMGKKNEKFTRDETFSLKYNHRSYTEFQFHMTTLMSKEKHLLRLNQQSIEINILHATITR